MNTLPTSEQENLNKSGWLETYPLIFRLIVIGVLTFLLLVPLTIITNIIEEREHLNNETTDEIASLWGQRQTIRGPLLLIPYETLETVIAVEGVLEGQQAVERTKKVLSYKIILPKEVTFSAEMNSEIRYRGIYDAIVYTAPIQIKGEFVLPSEKEFDPKVGKIYWDQATLNLGVVDLKAIQFIDRLKWNNITALSFDPGTSLKNIINTGFHAAVPINKDQTTYTFAVDMTINGSGGLFFTPVGERSYIHLSSAWPNPSFKGAVLPTDRKVDAEGFEAKWSLSHLSRSYPQLGKIGDYSDKEFNEFTAGVELVESVSYYRLVTRAVKYGLLFIGLTFIALLSFELVTKQPLHIIQYGLVGIAMCLFYLVLLSLTEHLPFAQAFALASVVSILMNGLYIAAALRSKSKGAIMILLLAGLYMVLYALLQLEDFALLVGTGLVVVVIGILMFLTRHVNLTAKDVAPLQKPIDPSNSSIL